MTGPLAGLARDARTRLVAAPAPARPEAMAATLTDARSSDPDWMFERKLDGGGAWRGSRAARYGCTPPSWSTRWPSGPMPAGWPSTTTSSTCCGATATTCARSTCGHARPCCAGPSTSATHVGSGDGSAPCAPATKHLSRSPLSPCAETRSIAMTGSSEAHAGGTLACWYVEPQHRPRMGACPTGCTGPSTHAERVGGGGNRTCCDAHAAWRRATTRLPTLVWRLAQPPAGHRYDADAYRAVAGSRGPAPS
jgi:hypothetical protein